MGENSGWRRWAQWNRRGPQKQRSFSSKCDQERMVRKVQPRWLWRWKMALSQGVWVPGKERGSLQSLQEERCPCWHLDVKGALCWISTPQTTVLCAKLRLLFATPWTAARQAPLSMGFSRQDYWSGLPFPSPGDLPNPGITPPSPASPALAGRFSTTELPGKPQNCKIINLCCVKSLSLWKFVRAATEKQMHIPCIFLIQ